MSTVHLTWTMRFAIIAFILSTPFLSVHAQNTTIPTFSTFDLFKNSGLIPCSISNTTNILVQNIDKRLPRGGGGGHSSGSGGHSSSHSSGSGGIFSSSGGSTHHYTAYGGSYYGVSAPLVYETWVTKGQRSWCQFVNSTAMPIVIPTKPTDLAFIPLYPTLIIQTLSLVPSFWGLHLSFEKHREQGRFPIWFWPQFVFDSARFVCWHLRIFQGFIDQYKLGWLSCFIWLLSLAYFFVFHSVRVNRQETSSESYGMVVVRTDTSYKPVDDSLAHPPPSHQSEDTFLDGTKPAYGEDLFADKAHEPLITEAPPQSYPMNQRQFSFFERFPLRPVTVTLFISTLLMWCFSLVLLILHRIGFGLSERFEQALVPLPIVSTNPESLAVNMPSNCTNYLKTTNLAAHGLYTQLGDVSISALFEEGQFLITTLWGVRWGFWLLKQCGQPDEPLRIAQALKSFRYMVTLMMPVFILANTIFLVVTVFGEKGAVNVVFTANATMTQNCTFATVGMDKRFGYFDVKEGLGLRIAQSVLGIA